MFASAALLFVATFLLLLLLHTERPKNFPPGPRPIPVFGNVLQLNAKTPLEDFNRLAKRYGSVYSIFIGPRPAVILNGLQAVKEALINKASDFSGRTHDLLVNRAFEVKAGAAGVVLADYCPQWREQRRFGLMNLRNFGLGKKAMEERILRETSRIVKILEDSIGKAVNPQVMFHNAASSIICQILFDTQLNYDDEFAKFFVNFFRESSKIVNGHWSMIYDAVGVLRCLPLPFQRLITLCKDAHERHMQLVDENKKTRIPGKPRHFIDCYLDELDKRGDDGSSFSEDQLCAVLMDLHFAGTDTTANTLLSALLYLMNHPQIQERCQQEIDMVLDGKDEASFEDRHNMPYMQAVIHEIQRTADTVPLSVFHCTTKDTELMGYSIPKGTIVIPNLSSVLFEEGQWKFPHEFNPENFLNDKGEFVKPDAFIPFSAGPRICLGEGLARMELFLILVTLLRKFQFVWPQDAAQPDYVPLFGAIQTPKPYHMEVQLRRFL